jgi:DNA-binding IclR family transcriptional regulator
MKNKPAYAIESVDNALQLAVWLQAEGLIGTAEAAERLGVSRSTAHRLFQMLVYRDFARQGPDRRYMAGPLLLAGQASLAPVLLMRRHALPHMNRLMSFIDETVTLQVLEGVEVRFIETVECPHHLRVGDRTGETWPSYQVSGGKALLAALPDHDVQRILAPVPGVDLPAFLSELAEIRSRGYAMNRDEADSGIIGIGVVIPGNPAPMAALTVGIPASRYDESQLQTFTSSLKLTAAAVADSFTQDMEHSAEAAARHRPRPDLARTVHPSSND